MADPADALGVEAVDGLVEEQHAGVAEQGAGDAEPLAHAEGELAGPPVGHGGEPDDVEHVVDARRRDVVGLGQPAQVVAGAAARVEGLGVEQGAHLAERPAQLGEGCAVDESRSPTSGTSRPRIMRMVVDLPEPFGPEEAGDDARGDGEAEVVDGDGLAVALRQSRG